MSLQSGTDLFHCVRILQHKWESKLYKLISFGKIVIHNKISTILSEVGALPCSLCSLQLYHLPEDQLDLLIKAIFKFLDPQVSVANIAKKKKLILYTCLPHRPISFLA